MSLTVLFITTCISVTKLYSIIKSISLMIVIQVFTKTHTHESRESCSFVQKSIGKCKYSRTLFF